MSTFEMKGGFAGLAASTRVRLARNVKGYPYHDLTPGQLDEIADKVWQAIQAAPALAQEFTMAEVRAGSAEAMKLIEQHKISPEFARTGGKLILSRDGGAALMLGEEDHIRLQVMGTGLCPKECMQAARRLAQLIENAVPFDYSDKLGYLTACPSNLGTGLRASVMLHLPVLTQSGAMERMIAWAARQGFTVRGAYGEGSQAAGGFYQISNQITLGLSEDAIIDKLIAVATEVIDNEKKAREQLRAADEDRLFDRVARAAGVLMTARLLSSEETADQISWTLVGLQMGYLDGVSPEALIAAEQNTRPAVLAGSPSERDRERARQMRALMQHVHVRD